MNVSAFTVAELGEMLPETVDIENGDDWRFFNQHMTEVNGHKQWQLRYGDVGAGNSVIANIIETTEADARAKMLIYLLEKGLIKSA